MLMKYVKTTLEICDKYGYACLGEFSHKSVDEYQHDVAVDKRGNEHRYIDGVSVKEITNLEQHNCIAAQNNGMDRCQCGLCD